jgi:RNA polymerase sigma-70 factor (ECF subfamily)
MNRQWRRYIDGLADYRQDLHNYCCRLTGNVWDGEDLVQDALVRVFRNHTRLDNPKAYLIRTATNLWIDRVRRSAREAELDALAEPVTMPDTAAIESRDAASALFEKLHPQERAAIVIREVFDFSLDETAAVLQTSTGAVKDALSRARGRLDGRRPIAGFNAPPKELVERFMQALTMKDMEAMRQLCSENVTGELVGGAEMHTFEKTKKILQYAHMVMPRLGFGTKPWWKVIEYEGEPVMLGFRTLNGVEGLNEIHRFEALDGRIVRLRVYCFCPDTLRAVAGDLGLKALPRPYRSLSAGDALKALVKFW